MVNHSILLNKSETYGVRGVALVWVKNYLISHVQYVSYNSQQLELSLCTCEVPQGFILELLFLFLYVLMPWFMYLRTYFGRDFFANDCNGIGSGINLYDVIN